jgi:hypothetical protein
MRLKNVWMAGDWDRFSRYMEGGVLEFYERLTHEDSARPIGKSPKRFSSRRPCAQVARSPTGDIG